jgi:phospholipid transport system transporter-binding protein
VSEPQLEQVGDGSVRVSGDLTFATVSEVLRESAGMVGSDPRALEIDLAGVRRADSAGLALLVHWLRQARDRGREVVFRNLPEQMLAIARVSDLQDILPRDEA